MPPTLDFQDYGYVCHLNENMILPKLSDDEVKPLDVPESCKCTTCVKRTRKCGSQDSNTVYSVDVQIMRIKDVKIPTRPRNYIIIMYIFQLLYILTILYYFVLQY